MERVAFAISISGRLRSTILIPLCFVLLILIHSLALSQPTIEVGFWGPGDYSDCDSLQRIIYYVGGTYDVTVTFLPENTKFGEVEYSGIDHWDWPEGLVLSAAKQSSESEEFKSSSSLRDHLHLEYYVTYRQAHFDSVWRATGESPPRGRTAPEYHFAFEVPPELAGSYLCFNAEWNHPQYGRLAAEKPTCVKIVAPCSEKGQFAVWRANISEANQQGKFQMVVALADSFIALGWHDLIGLNLAHNAATKLMQYEDAIRFLDLNFEWNHTISPIEGGQAPDHQPTEADQRLYQRQRAKLIELRDQQQQH